MFTNTVFCSLILYPSSDFPRGSLGITEKGSKYDAFLSTLSEQRRSCLTRPAVLCSLACVRSVCHSCFSARAAALSSASGAGHTGFLTPSGGRIPTFSRVDFTNFLDHIRKGCVPLYVPSSCRSRLRRATETGVVVSIQKIFTHF